VKHPSPFNRLWPHAELRVLVDKKLNKELRMALVLIYNGNRHEPQPCDLALGESCGCDSSASTATDSLNPNSVSCARNVVCAHVVQSTHALPTTAGRRLGDGLVVQLVLKRDTVASKRVAHLRSGALTESPLRINGAPYIHLQLVHVAPAGL
jgi:hypothetical protein